MDNILDVDVYIDKARHQHPFKAKTFKIPKKTKQKRHRMADTVVFCSSAQSSTTTPPPPSLSSIKKKIATISTWLICIEEKQSALGRRGCPEYTVS